MCRRGTLPAVLWGVGTWSEAWLRRMHRTMWKGQLRSFAHVRAHGGATQYQRSLLVFHRVSQLLYSRWMKDEDVGFPYMLTDDAVPSPGALTYRERSEADYDVVYAVKGETRAEAALRRLHRTGGLYLEPEGPDRLRGLLTSRSVRSMDSSRQLTRRSSRYGNRSVSTAVGSGSGTGGGGGDSGSGAGSRSGRMGSRRVTLRDPIVAEVSLENVRPGTASSAVTFVSDASHDEENNSGIGIRTGPGLQRALTAESGDSRSTAAAPYQSNAPTFTVNTIDEVPKKEPINVQALTKHRTPLLPFATTSRDFSRHGKHRELEMAEQSRVLKEKAAARKSAREAKKLATQRSVQSSSRPPRATSSQRSFRPGSGAMSWDQASAADHRSSRGSMASRPGSALASATGRKRSGRRVTLDTHATTLSASHTTLGSSYASLPPSHRSLARPSSRGSESMQRGAPVAPLQLALVGGEEKTTTLQVPGGDDGGVERRGAFQLARVPVGRAPTVSDTGAEVLLLEDTHEENGGAADAAGAVSNTLPMTPIRTRTRAGLDNQEKQKLMSAASSCAERIPDVIRPPNELPGYQEAEELRQEGLVSKGGLYHAFVPHRVPGRRGSLNALVNPGGNLVVRRCSTPLSNDATGEPPTLAVVCCRRCPSTAATRHHQGWRATTCSSVGTPCERAVRFYPTWSRPSSVLFWRVSTHNAFLPTTNEVHCLRKLEKRKDGRWYVSCHAHTKCSRRPPH